MNPLSNEQLAIVAQRLLMESGGFTLDEFGNSIGGDFWAVSVEGKEQKYRYLPSLQLIGNYLQASGGRGAAYFGGWTDDDDGMYYLDHTLIFQHKHTAVHEALRNHQKAIFHLGTKELLKIEEVEGRGLAPGSPALDREVMELRKDAPAPPEVLHDRGCPCCGKCYQGPTPIRERERRGPTVIPESANFDQISFIIAYENNQLESHEIIEGFQQLIDSGIVWRLHGSFGRRAVCLIQRGHCVDSHGVLPWVR